MTSSFCSSASFFFAAFLPTGWLLPDPADLKVYLFTFPVAGSFLKLAGLRSGPARMLAFGVVPWEDLPPACTASPASSFASQLKGAVFFGFSCWGAAAPPATKPLQLSPLAPHLLLVPSKGLLLPQPNLPFICWLLFTRSVILTSLRSINIWSLTHPRTMEDCQFIVEAPIKNCDFP